jgi:hypothetical protein
MMAMLEQDEQSLEHLAEADLAYLEMVRTKAGMGTNPNPGAFAASEAEQALADSWQQLIKLRLKSQKLQLRQRAQPMSDVDMERVESELMCEMARIASRLQQQLHELTSAAAAASPSAAAVVAEATLSEADAGADAGAAAPDAAAAAATAGTPSCRPRSTESSSMARAKTRPRARRGGSRNRGASNISTRRSS